MIWRSAAIFLLALGLTPNSLAFEPHAFETLDASKVIRLEAGEVVSEIWRDTNRNDGAIDAFAAIYIKATPDQIWSVMTSCELALDIVPDMKSCEVLQQSVEGWDVREQKFRAPFPFKDFRAVFRADYTPQRQIKIQQAGGDMKVHDALWMITPLGNGVSRVTYRAAVQPKIPVPQFLLRRAVRHDTPEILINLRNLIEADGKMLRQEASVRKAP